MIRCPSRDDLLRLLDGELTENRARTVREHAAGCAACNDELAAWRSLVRDLARPIDGPAGAVDRAIARLRAEPRVPVPPVWRGRMALYAAAAIVLAAAASVLFAVRMRGEEPSRFAARGGVSMHSFARDVDVALYASGVALVPLHDGDAIAIDTPLAVSYRNLGGLAYAMVFAVDPAGELHWIAPAYLSAQHDPASVPLPPTARDVVLPEATVLDAPGVDRVRVFIVITPEALRVSQLEALAGAIDERSLRRRWAEAEIRTVSLTRRQP